MENLGAAIETRGVLELLKFCQFVDILTFTG